MLKIKDGYIRFLGAFVVFAATLLLLYLKNDYNVLTELRIYGDFGDSCKYKFSWDTGEGFNDYETIEIEIDSGKKYYPIDLPYLTIYGIRLTAADTMNNGIIQRLVVFSEVKSEEIQFRSSSSGEIESTGLEIRHTRFEARLFGIQVFLALLFAWLFWELISLKKKLNKPDWKSVFNYVFRENGKIRFWIFFGISFSVFFCWLLGQWPGAMTPDSLWQWMQTKTLDFQDNHPYISSLYLVVLSQIWDCPAIVAIFQIILMSAFGSYIFWWLTSVGLKKYIAYIFFIFWISSIPIGLFNIILWKDVPFSILVAFWAFYIFVLYYNKKYLAKKPEHSIKTIVLLSILLIATGFIRHNGIIFLILIPLILFVFKLLEKRKVIFLGIIICIFFLVLKYIIPDVLQVKPIKSFFSSLSWKVNPIAALFQNRLHQGERTYYSDDYERDKRIFGRLADIDTLKKYYTPEHGVVLLLRVNQNIAVDDIDSINGIFYRLMAVNFPILLADRAYLFGALTFSLGSTIYINYLSNIEYVHSEIQDFNWPGGITLYHYKYDPLIFKVNELQNYIIIQTSIHPLRLIIWNYLIPILLLMIILFLYKFIPGSSLSAATLITQVPLIILTAASPDFRYLYFIYLFTFFIIPISILEYKTSGKGKSNDSLQ